MLHVPFAGFVYKARTMCSHRRCYRAALMATTTLILLSRRVRRKDTLSKEIRGSVKSKDNPLRLLNA